MFSLIYFLLGLSLAQSATISGSIKILKKNGSTVADASGVVVFVDGLTAKAPNGTKAKMEQTRKKFIPEVLPIVVGTEVEFPNNDPILHNVFSTSKAKTFDLFLYKKGVDKSVMFDSSGLVRVFCNIHEQMIGNILVLDNPYFSQTDMSGAFKILDVPQGKYELVAWHRFGDIHRKPLEIKGVNEIRGLIVEINEKEVDESHLNKWGRPYNEKY